MKKREMDLVRISESQALWLQMQMRMALPPLFFPAVKALLVSLWGKAVLTGSRATRDPLPQLGLLRDWFWSPLCGQCESGHSVPARRPLPRKHPGHPLFLVYDGFG